MLGGMHRASIARRAPTWAEYRRASALQHFYGDADDIAALVDDDCGLKSDGQVLVAENEADSDKSRARVQQLELHGFYHEELGPVSP